MKNSILTVIFLCLASMVCFAQKDMVTEERSIGEFKEIKVCCGINLYITEGETASKLKIETKDRDILDKIVTQVKDKKLRIYFKDDKKKSWNLFSSKSYHQKVNVYVTANNLKEIEASSGARVSSSNQLISQEIELDTSSGAQIQLNLKAGKLSCDASSGSHIELTGNAAFADLDVSSGASINLNGLTAEKVKAEASSGGSIKVAVTEEINANASSGGSIRYSGKPKTVNKNTSSGGNVRNSE